MALCSETRQTEGTWIHQDMLEAYRALNAAGVGFSAETWQAGRLVGGLYGVKLGRVLFGESMVSCVPDASKAALAHICQEADVHQIELIDCQVPTSHLISLGATLIDRSEFMQRIRELTE
jgi:Leu/Phe-tRNA-protein transferase